MSDPISLEPALDDERTTMNPSALRRAVLDHLRFGRAKDLRSATLRDVYFALANTVRDRLVHRWIRTSRTYAEEDPKRVYYLSAEYLLGRLLGNNLLNLGLYEVMRDELRLYGLELSDILDQEVDPGLGNGGLGRLAACFLDSMATLELPAMGYGIRYEFGIFHQEIRDGAQVERPDEWLRYGNPWEIERPEYTVEVPFGGRVVESRLSDGTLRHQWENDETVLGVPYDTPVMGFSNDTVNTLRLWSARASEQIDLEVFNDGDYRRAVEKKALSESISKVLYPRDDSPEGKELRLRQQYFFVCCAIADLMRRYKTTHSDFSLFPSKVAIQLNDTHPSIAIPELMRVLVDLEGLSWETAWRITQATFGYTNHTLLPEALERWPVPLFERLLPRHLQIIYEINARFLRQVHVFAPKDLDRVRRMSIIEEGPVKHVRMSYLSVVGSHKINGVAELHSDLVKSRLLKDFADLWPDRFCNQTNGVTPRRWLALCNPALAQAIDARIGRGWRSDLERMQDLTAYVDDPDWHAELRKIKGANKRRFAGVVQYTLGQSIDARSLFDVQVKRIHEYKRQLMNTLHLVDLYRRVKFDGAEIAPRTVFLGGKAAPGYATAKLHLRLFNDIAAIVNADRTVNDRLRAVFLANYNVTMAERVIPAADLSEQISLAGKEASGTGNMKFQMNGALTLGTLDGANIEIREEVGPENFFLFGLDAEQVGALREDGYHPAPYLEQSERLTAAIELIRSGVFCPTEPDRYAEIVDYLTTWDPYLICADFDAYVAAQEQVEEVWADRDAWSTRVAHNIARCGKFSSDRTILGYARDIWDLDPVPVDLQSSAERD